MLVMSDSSNELVQSALSLPPDDRAGLAMQLLQSLTPAQQEISDDQLSEQLHKRIQEYKSGDLISHSREEARAAVEAALSKRRTN